MTRTENDTGTSLKETAANFRAAGQGPPAPAGGHKRGSTGAWTAVTLIIVGFILGCFALPTHSLVLWILAGVALVAGGVVGLTSRIMEQAY
ncbi:hypothetical protein I6A84_31280 [Frankia sp. CNm7]|uniref:Uncharacterized protein n=1 Tax=Frankia nepalensis TaxID=1836974 RepID=A0A937RAV0_9ACTN|nr:hypothetical protein [Frankia nepalensis]MBL7501674.1 hypothetical protein [Frankia nepalensis]MBL7513398.1 hypothetical protein [Frankia nepalensis]MBL7522446.1 hypothetical protein [Frankia nepalensis]MBL7626352.1 hypothetical protein [Frankia nepalensis]